MMDLDNWILMGRVAVILEGLNSGLGLFIG